MFEIIDDEKKKITISLHLEEIYILMRTKKHIKNSSRLFSEDTISKSCVDCLADMNFKDGYSDYDCIVDFSHIRHVVPNSREKFTQWLSSLPNVKVCHMKEDDTILDLKKFYLKKDEAWDYKKAFHYYGRKYILEKCLDSKGYTTQIGVRLGVYIDLKRIINDSVEMLRWCYIIAYDLDCRFSSLGEYVDTNKKSLFFCHTMNGIYIAGILSQLLGIDLVYVDHLGPYNKLNKVDFYKGKSRSEKFIIITDLVCQGNEFLRAKNIVEYLGGTVRGSAGILRMDISDLWSHYRIDEYAIKYTSESAREELGYTIQTKLCPGQCEKCMEKEG